MYRQYKKIAVMAFIWLVIALPMVGQSKLLAPDKYPEGTCELAAKEFQKAYGGDLIFVQPLKDDGSFDFGAYNGAWLNKAWDKEKGNYYIYYPSMQYFNNTNEIGLWYYIETGKYSKIYDVNEVKVPFGIIWHY